jgi:hypothetical protein
MMAMSRADPPGADRGGYLVVLADANAVTWVLENQLMAVTASRSRQAANVKIGEDLFLYYTSKAYYDVGITRGGVFALGTVRSALAELSSPLSLAGRALTHGFPITIQGMVTPGRAVDLAALAPRLKLFVRGRWGPQLQKPLVPLPAEDGAVLRSLLSAAIAQEKTGVEMYRALGARNSEWRARRLAGRSSG